MGGQPLSRKSLPSLTNYQMGLILSFSHKLSALNFNMPQVSFGELRLCTPGECCCWKMCWRWSAAKLNVEGSSTMLSRPCQLFPQLFHGLHLGLLVFKNSSTVWKACRARNMDVFWTSSYLRNVGLAVRCQDKLSLHCPFAWQAVRPDVDESSF